MLAFSDIQTLSMPSNENFLVPKEELSLKDLELQQAERVIWIFIKSIAFEITSKQLYATFKNETWVIAN
ncbi:MAG: hypothetical protein AB7D28_07320 [Candidatus Berkiella sp.]